MTEIPLTDLSVIIEIHDTSDGLPRKYILKDGKHINGKTYSSLMIIDEKVALKGGIDTLLISTEAKIITVTVKSSIEKASEILNDTNIFMSGIDAIPEGQEREILAAILRP